MVDPEGPDGERITSSLSADEKEQFRILQADYAYDRKERALGEIRIPIFESIK